MYKLLFFLSILAWSFLFGYFIEYGFSAKIPKVRFSIKEMRNVDFVVPRSKVRVCSEFDVEGIPTSCVIEMMR